MAVQARSGLSFLRRSQNLLESSARMLGLRLEVHVRHRSPLVSHRIPRTCGDCRRRMGDLFQSCQERRATYCRAAARRGTHLEWSCPRGLGLSAYPIPGIDGVTGALLGIDPNGSLPLVDAGSVPSFRSQPIPFPLSHRKAGRHGPQVRRQEAFLADMARLLSDQFCLHRELRSLSTELGSRCDELQMLYSIAGRLTTQQDLRQSLRQMLEQARRTIEADAALLVVRERKLREVVLRPGLAGLDAASRGFWNRTSQGLLRRLAQGGRRYYVGIPWEDTEAPPAMPGPAQALAVSVTQQGQPSGFLALLHLDPHRSFRTGDIKLLESLSEQIGLAVANTELYEDLKDFLMGTVKTLVSAIEEKDSYTSGHSERVNLISMLIGKKLGLTSEEMETLRWASILHDVGKIGMPEAILSKPGKLTREEYEIIKEHPDRGYRLLSPIRQLAQAAIIIRAHHEMVNGAGYPEGLSGTEIPKLARIIAVADTYDAVTSTRPYRNARTLDFAFAEIERVRGTQLDAEMVDCFLELAPFLREHHIMINADAERIEEEAA